MRPVPEWVPGQKHPNTPRTAFMNCYEYDKVRKVLKGRCKICDIQIAIGPETKELMYRCEGTACNCGKLATHVVCSLCYDLFHILYANYQMKNRNYFKDMDDKQREDFEGYKRRNNGTT